MPAAALNALLGRRIAPSSSARCAMYFRALAVRSSVGLAALALLNQIGLGLGVNLVNALILGVLGVPGLGLLLMLQWVLRT